ncbi:unnamed protein product [Heterobilharzia americana]|nr:unnamed protein product [Heterobilharzia americana]
MPKIGDMFNVITNLNIVTACKFRFLRLKLCLTFQRANFNVTNDCHLVSHWSAVEILVSLFVGWVNNHCEKRKRFIILPL